MKKIVVTIILLIVSLLAVGCGAPKYNDGEYIGEYKGDGESKTVVKIVLKDQKIESCELELYDDNGRLKDEHYGENSGEANFAKAQLALKGTMQYPQMLVELQNIDDMDAISGATVSLKEFTQAVNDALKKAE